MPLVVAVALAAVALSPGAAPRLAATIPTGTAPRGAAVAPGGVWVANDRSGTLVRIDPRRNRLGRARRLLGHCG